MATNSNLDGPQFVQYFQPVLDALRELGDSARPAEVRDQVVEMLSIPKDVQSEVLPSGQSRFDNRIAWARFYLVRGGFIDSSRRGVWALTDTGRTAHLSHEDALELFRSIHSEFPATPRKKSRRKQDDADSDRAPDEVGGSDDDYKEELIGVLQSLPPDGFERFCQRLLREAGFLDVTVTGRAGDGGIDGIGVLQVNALVTFKVLFQCKRYQGSVSPSQVRDFRGAMQGRTDKGIIITTGRFTSEAKREAVRDGVPPIELVDGEKLVEMLEELELGLIPIQTYRVEPRFFDDFRSKPDSPSHGG